MSEQVTYELKSTEVYRYTIFKDGSRTTTKKRVCQVLLCENISVSGGMCIRHGATRSVNRLQCSEEGCESTAKYRNKCKAHGGSIPTTYCSVHDCKRPGYQYGELCYMHSVDTRVFTEDVGSSSVTTPKVKKAKCKYIGCNKPRTTGVCCNTHAKSMSRRRYSI
jgi:hypothetical protein